MLLRGSLLALSLFALGAPTLHAQTAQSSRFEPLRADGNGVTALQRPVSVQISEIPLAEALRAVARDAGVSITIPSDLPAGASRVSLNDSSVAPAAAMLRMLRGLDVELLVSPPTASLILRQLEPAPAGTILGAVTDSATGEPLPGVQVQVAETGTGALSDAQ